MLAPASSPFILFLQLLLLLFPVASLVFDTVEPGFSASRVDFVDDKGAFLKSANDTFRLGFRSYAQGFFLAIWHFETDTVVWMANRNSPVAISDPVVFGADGDFSLNTSAGKLWSTQTAGSEASLIRLQETGNLCLLRRRNGSDEEEVVWQSFQHPTHTLLPGQKLDASSRLVACVSATDPAEGIYSLRLWQGDLILEAMLAGVAETYWSMARDARVVVQPSATGAAQYATLVDQALGLYTSDAVLVSQFPVGSAGAFLRLVTLHVDGSLGAFYFQGPDLVSSDAKFIAPGNKCELPVSCGPLGTCASSGQCICSQPLLQIDPKDPSQGCRLPPQLRALQGPCEQEKQEAGWLEITNFGGGIDFFANRFTSPAVVENLTECQQQCVERCDFCAIFVFWEEEKKCFLVPRVATLQSGSDPTHSAYAKVYYVDPAQVAAGGGGVGVGVILAVVLVVLVALVSGLVGVWWWRRKEDGGVEDELFFEAIPGLPLRFTYKELVRATGGFERKLGAGGFGSVYEGSLPDGSRVAVKQLERLGQGSKEFRAEVATIGSIHHLHLVQLRGFCAEGVHRLLVYEYLANGSLDNWLFDKRRSLEWETRFDIALGTARGLAYLHEECREKIIHCDIKPENILLDDYFVAKVSDFGLAKLMNRELSQVFTTMRGTRGYLAPEWVTNCAITEKSDVFSFGMVLLEVVSGRKNFDPTVVSEQWYFPAYAHRQLEIGRMEDLVDPKLNGLADAHLVVLAIRVALWCIQEDVNLRPSMRKVVQMLEGNINVANPPVSSQFFRALFPKLSDAASGSSSQSVHGFDGFGEYEGIRLSQQSAERLSGPR